MREALATGHLGRVVRAFRTHPYHGRPIPQCVAASWFFLTQAQLSRIENGPPVQDLDRLGRWAHILHIPSGLLWFSRSEADMPEGGSPYGVEPHTSDSIADDEWLRMSDLLRRTFLKRGMAAVTLPAIGLDELKHITAALSDARRYTDQAVVGYFRRQLHGCAEKDGARGPKQSIPIVLGLIAAIEQMASEAKPAVRRELLTVGSQTAEFTGWLYRDIAMPELANYWRDRAVEWAQAAGDLPMQGYVLLKKSQAAWDERDALRMLTLAQAAQEGPWQLPVRVRAEAAQQEARGHAMLGGDLALVEPKLDQARALLAKDTADTGSTPIAAHYDEALFALQVAICYCEAGRSDQALALYDTWLTVDTFSRRDYGYFLALKSEAFVAAEEPDEASVTGLQALSLARETNSARTYQEVLRVVGQLQQWRDRAGVRELRAAVLA
jgi:tetratricopeptide (TPR) repeat protein